VGLAPDELFDVGVIASRITIFAARRVLPPDLIVPAEASAPRMNDTGPLAVPHPRALGAGANLREVHARARTTLEDDALFGVPIEDRTHRVIDTENEAGAGLLGTPFTPMLNQTVS